MKRNGSTPTGDGLFRIVEGAQAILYSKGQFFQADIYSRGTALFAEVGKDRYARLMHDGRTSTPSVSWDEIHGAKVEVTSLGGVFLK